MDNMYKSRKIKCNNFDTHYPITLCYENEIFLIKDSISVLCIRDYINFIIFLFFVSLNLIRTDFVLNTLTYFRN